MITNVGDRVMTAGMIMTVLNKFRLCAILMFQTSASTNKVLPDTLRLKVIFYLYNIV